MKIYRMGVVGTGFIGRVHVETVRRLGNVEVVALADTISAKEAAESLNVPQYFTDYRQMIDTMKLDVLHICTPNNTHFEIAMYAMDHGVHIICEKPMCVSIEEAQALTAKARETGLIAAINFHNRFYPMNNHLKNVIQDGELGEIFSITGSYTQDWLLYETDYSWRLNSSESGSTRAVADIGSHWMDLAEYVTGQKIVAVNADFSTIHPTRKKPKGHVIAFSKEKFAEEDYEDIAIDTEDNASVMFRFSNGAKGSAFFSQVIAGKSVAIDLLVGGYRKSAEWNSEVCNQLTIGQRDSYNQVMEKGIATVHSNTRPLIAYPFGHLEGFPDAFKQCFANVYNSIDNPKVVGEYATFEDGLHEMVLCSKIFESNQKQQWVNIPSNS
ncbi:Gfo/Idh/MocA family protein [Lacrimispora sp.]|uniref:Gfo/Idh/MocA family protein n=1 Tax=Lacrimispora sp. TaxID=2719234 RepID=UPI002896FE7C|nr:Gfo/Idh/MocA family oxidoreductase [Lacrimispora sp.]